MKRSNRLVLLIGIFLAVVAFVGIALVLGGSRGPGGAAPTAPTTLNTVVATRDIPLGATLTAEMLEVKVLPISERKAQSFENPSQIIGLKARRAITTGAQIEAADFSEAVTSLEVPAGLRGLTVQVDQVSGVGTLIKTGDYIDMVVGLSGDKFPVITLNPEDDSITVVAGLNSTSVKVLLQGIQVVGTLRPAPAPAAQGGAAPAPSPGAGPTTTLTGESEIVVLAVTAQQEEIIKFAQLDGSISLALRSSKDFFDEQGNPIVSAPEGTSGITLKVLVDGGYGVLRPELIEAILPRQ